jgi:hypothetical protein
MAKNDYTSSTITDRYKTLVTKPTSALSTVTVADDEKRTRAEMLDIIEELFDSEKDLGDSMLEENPPIDNEQLRAVLHILTKSISNTLDDGLISFTTADMTLSFGVSSSRGSYSLDITVVDNSGRSAVTKTASIALS